MTDDNTPFISPLADNIINGFVDELKKKRNKEKIMKNIIEPILSDINDKYYPYILTLSFMMSFIILLLLMLLMK